MHIISLQVAAATASIAAGSELFERLVYDLHAIYGGYIDFQDMQNEDPSHNMGDILLLGVNHPNFHINLEAQGGAGREGEEERFKFVLTYHGRPMREQFRNELPGDMLKYEAYTIFICTDAHGIVSSVEF